MKKEQKKNQWWQNININPKTELIILCGLFLLAVGIYFYLSNHLKVFGMYHDDLRHYDMARSIFNGEGLTIHHANWYFQKIFYPLCISPFFAIDDVYLRMSMIALFNSLMLALSIFPLWLITKELKMDVRYRLACVILFLFTPVIALNETCFSESLYSPMLLLFVYLLMINYNKQNYYLSIGLGIYSYVIYLTKEAGILFVICYILFEILYPLFNRLTVDELERGPISSYYEKRRLINGGLHLASFLLCFLIFKFTLFRGWPNSYDTGNDYDLISIKILFEGANFGWFLYGCLYALVTFIAVVFILPFIYPIMTFKHLNDRQKQLTIFLMLIIVISSVVFSYTLTIREDLGALNPKLHHRYVFPIIYILVILFIDILRNREHTLKLDNYKPLNIAIVSACVLVFFIFKGGRNDTGLESPNLMWYQNLWLNMPSFKINDQAIYIGWFVGNSIIIIIAIGLHIYTLKEPIKFFKTEALTYVALFTFSVLSIGPARNLWFNRVEYKTTQEVISINNFVKSLPEEERYVLYIAHGEKKPVNNYSHLGIVFDDYFDETRNLYYSTTNKILSYLDYTIQEKSVSISQMEFLEWYNGYLNPSTNHINYLVIPSDIDITLLHLTNIEVVNLYNNYALYRNLDPSTIRFLL